ncbi:T9SS type A sorting domain-containing protein [Cytophagaceae bacterium DM2B3-1]|uniref:T9SS type A sorting domain-containing protein n=1 Tax=Xanthocytophaga flava TaxID=3048013 RepID=A0AAE3QKV6_9BACT|nr:T9SS type A sorting domain-containing protein [Xanthocytophaga flavus]MDJ1466641.1 T9SS type A sorting domain-containing protein [Xanthocytophaga flavus]MDJ1479293.1 T9SS type A sorting domain-containing protein [Xanthocytophaga flavus]MDJ1492637.1 T9SS type A sorting domain-containing protein [Xanthocytophaga flavus]
MRQLLLIFLSSYFLTCSVGVWAVTPTEVRIDSPSVKYTHTTFQGGVPAFSNDKITISGIYPNPATTSAALEYDITGELKEAKILISNVLGSSIGEYKLTREGHKMQLDTSEFAPGIYFYTLSVDGKSIFTRKLIIRHSS